MLDKLTGKPIHATLHFIACLAIAVGLPWSKIPLSLGTMLLILNVVLEGNFREYWIRIKNTPLLGFLWLFISCELLSLLWSSDWNYALHDFRVKLPLLVIPLVMTIQILSEKNKRLITAGFLISLLITSLINVGSYHHWWGNRTYSDVRELSLFESHIRYALLIVMGLGIAFNWLIFEKKYTLLSIGLIVWLGYYTFISQVVSGYVAFIATVVLVGFFMLKRIRNVRKRKIAGLAIASFIALFAVYVVRLILPVSHKVDLSKLPVNSPNGNKYAYDIKHMTWESGYPVQAYIDQGEMQEAWNKVSKIDYATGTDANGSPMYWTIWRYMASKGLRKDSIGFTKLTHSDIRNMEKGIPSVEVLKSPFHARMYGIRLQLKYQDDPNGHSLLQRFEYWKTAFAIIQTHFIFGVGAGDVKQAYADHYQSNGTVLEEKYQLRAHNQYITSWVSSGIPGFLSFFIWWIVAFVISVKRNAFLAACFVAIAMTSFCMEDTLETQVGVTFVAFFLGYYFLQKEDKTIIT